MSDARATIESTDPVFDDYNRKFTSIEQSTDKLLKDAKVFSEAVISEFIQPSPHLLGLPSLSC